MHKLTQEQVEHIARLARLRLLESEKAQFAEHLSAILEYVGQLGELDTSGAKPMARVLDIKNVTREDEIQGCPQKSRELIIKNFPDKKDDLCKVPGIFS